MALSRKRRRELKKLKRSADQLWDEQRETLEHAAAVLRRARHSASDYAREDVAPAVRKAYDTRFVPAVRTGVRYGQDAAYGARSRLAGDVIPAMSGAVGSALAVLEASRDPRVREAVKNASKANKSYTKAAVKWVAPAKRSSGPGAGAIILIGLGAVAAVGVAYAAWQTFRADDDLWIEDLGEDGTAL